MKRFVFLLLAAVLMSLTASAVPVQPGLWFTLTLADGTTVRAEAHGSEYGSWWEDADGQCYVLQEDGLCVKIDRQTLSENIKKSRAARRQPRRIIDASTVSGLGYPGWNSGGAMPSNGEWDIPVLMVEFSDAKFKPQHTTALIQDYLTKEGFKYEYNNNSRGSVRDYFVAQSQGKFKPNFKLLGKVTINKSYTYYGKNSATDKDEKCKELPGDAMRAAKEQLGVDFTQFSKPAPDTRHTAGIPLLCMLYAGVGEMQKPENPDLLWPHQFDYRGQGTEIEGIVEGKTVHLSSYFVGNELTLLQQDEGPAQERLMGIGVFCHELGHALGLPDWYCTDDAVEKQYPNDDAFGNWSTMDRGCYEGDAWAPVGYTAYERSYMGWLGLSTFKEKGSYTLTAPFGTQYAFYIPKTDDVNDPEYFIVETRAPSTWFPESQGTGLMVSRYAYNQDAWVNDEPNNDKLNKRGFMITANGMKINYNAFPANLFGNGVNSVSGLKYHSGAAATFTISNIKKNSDGSVTFDFDPGTGTGITLPTSDLSRQSSAWYDLQGRLLQGTPTANGVYIHNGKKTIIK